MAWKAVLKAEELPEGGMKLHPLGKRDVGIFRREGKLFAVLNFCPHAGAPICRGEVEYPVFVEEPGGAGRRALDQPTLRCPWHHWEFDLRSGKSLCPISPRLKTYAVREEEGWIWMEVG